MPMCLNVKNFVGRLGSKDYYGDFEMYGKKDLVFYNSNLNIYPYMPWYESLVVKLGEVFYEFYTDPSHASFDRHEISHLSAKALGSTYHLDESYDILFSIDKNEFFSAYLVWSISEGGGRSLIPSGPFVDSAKYVTGLHFWKGADIGFSIFTTGLIGFIGAGFSFPNIDGSDYEKLELELVSVGCDE